MFALLGLLALAPLLGVMSVVIKADSPGPVFFRQNRVGLGGRIFTIFKLRTMVDSTTVRGPELTVGDDIRITRVGRVMRRYKLDELPQLLNVVRGDMSLVGPRPEVPSYVAAYPPQLRAIVLSVRPGITDLASIAYRAESSLLANSPDPEREYLEVVLPAKLRYASDYVSNQSLWLDLKIILRTLIVLLTQRN